MLQIESIVDSDDGVMSSTDALNLTSQLEKKMLKKDAEDLISKFERDNWLELVRVYQIYIYIYIYIYIRDGVSSTSTSTITLDYFEHA